MVEFGIRQGVVITIDRYMVETGMQAGRSYPVSDNKLRDERLAEIEDTLVRYGVLRPDTQLPVAQ